MSRRIYSLNSGDVPSTAESDSGGSGNSSPAASASEYACRYVRNSGYVAPILRTIPCAADLTNSEKLIPHSSDAIVKYRASLPLNFIAWIFIATDGLFDFGLPMVVSFLRMVRVCFQYTMRMPCVKWFKFWVGRWMFGAGWFLGAE